MNYHHIYHAGNFADVIKHLTLCLILEKLTTKDNPFFVIDTHSGIGKYDLSSLEANKTGEYKNGIMRLYNQNNLDPIFSGYFNIIKKLNRLYGKELRIYPGSGTIIKYFLRPKDRAILAELNPKEFVALKRQFAGNQKIKTYNCDGYKLLNSNLPPQERRGLVFIDPPFEKANGKEDDFKQILKHLAMAYKKFAIGIYLIWYPIVDQKSSKEFLSKIKTIIKNDKILVSEIIINDKIEGGFKGCGLLTINCPWLFDEKIKTALSIMTNLFADVDSKPSSRVFYL